MVGTNLETHRRRMAQQRYRRTSPLELRSRLTLRVGRLRKTPDRAISNHDVRLVTESES